MQLIRQSTVSTIYVGPVLDSAGAAITNAVLGDFRLIKNGTAATLTGATVTHDANGHYTIALTTGNTDTLGRLTIASGNTAHAMATHRYSVLPASVFDAIVSNATNGTGGLLTATGAITGIAGTLSTFAGGSVSSVSGSVGSVTSPVTVGTNNDKTGYSLALAPPSAASIADEVRIELTTELARIDMPISGLLGAFSTVTDWTANERTALRAILGIPNSGTTPEVPTSGILHTIASSIDALPTATETYDYFTESTRADAFKADVSGLATTTQLNDRTLPAADYFNPTTDAVTVGTNNDKIGYELAADQAVNVTKVGGTSVSGPNDLKADVSLLATTSQLNDRTLLAADYFDPTTDIVFINYISANLVASAVRSELSGELNRLDTSISSRASQTSLNTVDGIVDAILADTNELQTNQGNWLTANVSSIQTVTNKLDTMLVADGLVYQFTANAVELVPTGSGGGGASAAENYAYFTDGTRANAFKADVSLLATTSQLNARTLLANQYALQSDLIYAIGDTTFIKNRTPELVNQKVQAWIAPADRTGYSLAADQAVNATKIAGVPTIAEGVSITFPTVIGDTGGGGGSDPWSADLTTYLEGTAGYVLAGINPNIDNSTDAILGAIEQLALESSGGTQVKTITLTMTSEGLGIHGVYVYAVGTSRNAYSDSYGVATLSVSPSTTYTLRFITPVGFVAIPDMEVILGTSDTSIPITLTRIAVPEVSEGLCALQLYLRSQGTTSVAALEDVNITAKLVDGSKVVGPVLHINIKDIAVTDVNGYACLILLQNATYDLAITQNNSVHIKRLRIVTPAESSAIISEVV